MNDPISAEEYFRGTLKVIAHWSEVDLSAEWETGLRGVIRSITDAAREVLSAHPTSQHSSSPGAAFAEPTTVAANAYDGSDARPNSGLDSRDRGHNEVLIRQLREIATEFAIDNKTDCKQHVCWIVADRLQRSSEQSSEADSYHKFWIEERSKRIAAEALAKLNTDARLRVETRLAETVQNIEAIKQATIDGRVCDDIAWFDTITTLHDFCELAILDASISSSTENGK